MKTIRIFLFFLIVLGIVLLLTQKWWVQPLIKSILDHEGTPQSLYTPDTADVVHNSTTDWNWVLSEVSSQGTQFMYPSNLNTRYVTAQDWPPVVYMGVSEFSCTEGDALTQDGLQKHSEFRTVNDHTYCVSISSEGAAGSTYTTYEYSTEQGDFVTKVVFTLRTPQCLNFDEPEQSECKTEQADFNTDILADQIATSVRMQ